VEVLLASLAAFYALLLLGTLARIANYLEKIAAAYDRWDGGKES
jgi:hypothetical protein